MTPVRIPIVLLAVLSVAPAASGQAGSEQTGDGQVKEELKKLHLEYQEAGSKRDRAALERLFADGYVWVQGNGSVTTKAKLIDNILKNTAPFSAPAPSFEQLTLHGDTAILRVTEREGLYATTVFARSDGRWQFMHAQGTLLPPSRKTIELDPKLLDAFVGTYEFGPGAVAVVTKEDNALMWKGGRRPQVQLMPLSETRFFVEESGVEMTFHKNSSGQVTDVSLRIGTCQDSQAKRVGT